jgi:Autotransporter beta-domain.
LHGGNGSIRGTSGMLYAQQAVVGFLLDGVATYGNTDWTKRRADRLGGAWLSSRTSGSDALASASLRLPMRTVSGNRIEPYASVTWQKVERDGVNERGRSAAALALDDLSQKGTRVLADVTMGSKATDPLATKLTWRESSLGAQAWRGCRHRRPDQSDRAQYAGRLALRHSRARRGPWICPG